MATNWVVKAGGMYESIWANYHNNSQIRNEARHCGDIVVRSLEFIQIPLVHIAMEKWPSYRWLMIYLLRMVIVQFVTWNLPSGNFTVRYWTYPIEIVDLPIKNGGSFQSFFYTFTRGYIPLSSHDSAMLSHCWAIKPPLNPPDNPLLTMKSPSPRSLRHPNVSPGPTALCSARRPAQWSPARCRPWERPWYIHSVWRSFLAKFIHMKSTIWNLGVLRCCQNYKRIEPAILDHIVINYIYIT